MENGQNKIYEAGENGTISKMNKRRIKKIHRSNKMNKRRIKDEKLSHKNGINIIQHYNLNLFLKLQGFLKKVFRVEKTSYNM